MPNEKETGTKPKTWQWWVEKVFMPILLALLSGYFLLIAGGIIESPFGSDEPAPEQLQFTDCIVELECPEVERIWGLYPDHTEWNAERIFETSIPANKPIRFSTGWCTKEQVLLQESLDEIEYVFTIDGISYAEKLKFQYDANPDTDESTQNDYCQVGGTVVSNWQPGKKYNIEFGIIVKEALTDGWREYVTGEKLYSHFLLVIE